MMKKSILAEKQLQLVPWGDLRGEYGNDARQVGEDLRLLLFGEDADAAIRVECSTSNQGHLFQCAPAAVSVIVAAVAEGAIPAENLGSSLDVLGLILAGYADESEVALGNSDLREQCHAEAMKGYWSLLRVACERDFFNAWKIAQDVLRVLDEAHSRQFKQ